MAAPRKYPDELRERAVRLYRESELKPVIRHMAEQLGVRHEALRNWIREDQADHGGRGDRPTTAELEELRRLRKENAELRGASKCSMPSESAAAASGAEHCKRDVSPAVLEIDVAVLIARVDADLEALTSAFKLPKIRDEGPNSSAPNRGGAVITRGAQSAATEPWASGRAARR